MENVQNSLNEIWAIFIWKDSCLIFCKLFGPVKYLLANTRYLIECMKIYQGYEWLLKSSEHFARDITEGRRFYLCPGGTVDLKLNHLILKNVPICMRNDTPQLVLCCTVVCDTCVIPTVKILNGRINE